MMIGVSYDEFWNGDYTRLKYAAEAYRLKREERNKELWLQGFYFFDAVSVAIYNALPHKGQPNKTYTEPIRITPQTEAEKEAEANNILETFKAQLTSLTGRLERRETKRAEEVKAKAEAEAMIHGSRKPNL